MAVIPGEAHVMKQDPSSEFLILILWALVANCLNRFTCAIRQRMLVLLWPIVSDCAAPSVKHVEFLRAKLPSRRLTSLASWKRARASATKGGFGTMPPGGTAEVARPRIVIAADCSRRLFPRPSQGPFNAEGERSPLSWKTC